MSNLYHIIDKIPSFEKYGIEIEYEDLANQLVDSGLLRIDTDDKCNFIRFSEPSKLINKSFSYREVYSVSLQSRIYNYFQSIYYSPTSPNILEKKIVSEIEKLKKSFSKLQAVEHELELKLARLFVQAAHPIAIHWILLENVEVFITYSQMIGDVMDIQTWQVAGQNSGMQSTNGIAASIFVSCGGNPFGEINIQYPTFGNGLPAIARLQIIAAQEIGHYSDIIRDSSLRHIDRHSADINGRYAKPKVSEARYQDVTICNNFLPTLNQYGLEKLVKYEEAVKFFRKNKIFNLSFLYHFICSKYYRYRLLSCADNLGINFIRKFSKDRYFGLMLKALTLDMSFNLTPVADVYKRANKDEENAISCIEALARVPQQVIKWGHLPTRYFMKNLYDIYYGEVIPDLIETYEKTTGKVYKRNYKINPLPVKIKILNLFSKLFFHKNKKPSFSREI